MKIHNQQESCQGASRPEVPPPYQGYGVGGQKQGSGEGERFQREGGRVEQLCPNRFLGRCGQLGSGCC